ncbi:MAG: hypothetical protein LIO78_04560 [Clostridiales bacterium]|nr:hypothetical protein [Clostridiales bacterium]
MNRFFPLSLFLALAFLLAGCTPAATTDTGDSSALGEAICYDPPAPEETAASAAQYTGVITARFTEGAGADQAEVLTLETADGAVHCTLLEDSQGDLSAAVGDRVTAECQVVEGAPDYHPILTLMVLEQAASAGETAAWETDALSLSVTLPEGWDWGFITDDTDNVIYVLPIAFWRSDTPELEVTLALYPSGIGMCGTGVAIEQVSLSDGLTDTTYTEGQGENLWFTLIYEDVDGLPEGAALAARYNGSAVLWGEWAEDVYAILSTVQYQGDFLPWADALEMAKSDFALLYGYTPEDWNGALDPDTGVWTVTFYEEDEDGNLVALETRTVDGAVVGNVPDQTG